MSRSEATREQARQIWQAGIDAVNPLVLVQTALTQPDAELARRLLGARRIIVVGGGKAGAAMAAGVEAALAGSLDRLQGIINVPAETIRPLRALRLHAARPMGINHPTLDAVAGVQAMLAEIETAGPEDLVLCLLSGGGSALLPAPAAGLTLADKQQVTALLHASGASIQDMNCVRKHLSAIKGGRLAQAAARRGVALVSLIISDVVGDPVDVIASGPTAADPTTFADALAVLARHGMLSRVPPSVLNHLERGQAGQIPETPKALPEKVINRIVGNNPRALAAAANEAHKLGYQVLNLGGYLEGNTQALAGFQAALVRSVHREGQPLRPPACILSGGETTVTLPPEHGKGGRNQEFVLALAGQLGQVDLANTVVLSGGSDGEDGPTDAAGACADLNTLHRAREQGLDLSGYLARHDAYSFFDATGDLLRTGLTSTNVMDIRVVLIRE